jgi:nicotinamidase-related amidase
MDRLRPESTVLVVVDVQDKLASVMPKDAIERLVANATILLEAARVTGVRVLASEQYPKGLGPTLAPIAEKLNALGVQPIDKVDFDACGEPRFVKKLAEIEPRAAVVIGMETHICVFQTARELVRRGLTTYVVSDAVTSRKEENRLAGLDLCTRAGAIPTVTEAVAFDWVGKAGTDAFKTVSKLIR